MDTVYPRQIRSARETRTEIVRVRCTPSERKAIEELANVAGQSLSDFVRAGALSVDIRGRVEQRAIYALADAVGHMNVLGAQLKQWLAARDGDDAPAASAERVLAEIEAAVRDVHEKVAAL